MGWLGLLKSIVNLLNLVVNYLREKELIGLGTQAERARAASEAAQAAEKARKIEDEDAVLDLDADDDGEPDDDGFRRD